MKPKHAAILMLLICIAAGGIVLAVTLLMNRVEDRQMYFEKFGISPEDILEYNRALVVLHNQDHSNLYSHAPYLEDMATEERIDIIQKLEMVEHTLDSILADVPNDDELSNLEFRMFIKSLKDGAGDLSANIPDASGAVG